MATPEPDKPENSLHHIQRLNYKNRSVHSWQVKAERNLICKSKNFCDKKYGGREEALKAAIRYRDELLAQIDHFSYQKWIRSIVHTNNTSGIPGVVRLDRMNKNTRYVCWGAKWVDEFGKRHHRWFSVSRYGEHEAKRLAIAERKRQLERVCAAKGSHWSDPFMTQKKKEKPNPQTSNDV
jgi:hypothetical protein